LSNVPDERVFEFVEKLAPNELDKNDTYQIEKSIKDAKKVREEEL
jgi:hypothetical protein